MKTKKEPAGITAAKAIETVGSEENRSITVTRLDGIALYLSGAATVSAAVTVAAGSWPFLLLVLFNLVVAPVLIRRMPTAKGVRGARA